MKVKIFVNWSEREIMTEKQSEAECASRFNDKDIYEDYRSTYLNDIIEEWFQDKIIHHTEYYKKIFDLSAEERAEIENKCRKSYEEQVKEEFSDDWEEITLEV